MATISKGWHTEPGPSATSRQVTQYGIRLPDGTIHWGDVTMPHQPTSIVNSGLQFTVFTDPAPEADSSRTIVSVRGRIADHMAAAYVPYEEAVAHATKTVRVSRSIFIGFGETEEVAE
jgi:hypothetical protein